MPVFVLNEVSKQCEGKTPDDLVFLAEMAVICRDRNPPAGGLQGLSNALRFKDHPARSSAHRCLTRGVERGERPGSARMLGHKDPSITLRVYADLFDTDLDAVAVSLHNAYSPESVGKMWARTAEGEARIASR